MQNTVAAELKGLALAQTQNTSPHHVITACARDPTQTSRAPRRLAFGMQACFDPNILIMPKTIIGSQPTKQNGHFHGWYSIFSLDISTLLLSFSDNARDCPASYIYKGNPGLCVCYQLVVSTHLLVTLNLGWWLALPPSHTIYYKCN